MKIDLHNHTSPASPCGEISPENLIREAIATGLDGIAITEHDNFNSAKAIRLIAARIGGLRVFVGIECGTDKGHVLAFGVQPPYPDQPRPMPLAATLDWIHSQGGVAIIAHPFRTVGFSPRNRLASIANAFDAMEVINARNSPDENKAALAVQRQLGIVAVAGSDTHESGRVGHAFTVFDEEIADETALADAIRRGACRIACHPSVMTR